MVHFLDILECTLGIDDCHDNATCSETPGSFMCKCNSGYTGNGTFCRGNYVIMFLLNDALKIDLNSKRIFYALLSRQ